jgi:hypothetical protein
MPTPALYINEFTSGLYTQRSPLVTPTTSIGLSTVVRMDVLADGLNTEMTNRSTIGRRPGYSRYCSAAFGASDYPLNFHSFRNLSGAVKLLVDTPNRVNVFTPTAQSLLFLKTPGSSRTRFCTVANSVFMVNGVDTKRYDGTNLSDIGIDAPALAPTITIIGGSLSPIKGYKWCYAYRDDNAQHEGTASPFSASTLGQTNKNFTLQGPMSTDPRVTSIVIYRILDGGSIYYKVASVTNTGSGNWTYTDSSTDDQINNFIAAQINHANDPPPDEASNIIFHMGRLWLAVGNAIYFAGGPDTLVGSGLEAWPPANRFTVPGAITAMVSVSSGLLVFTDSDTYIVRGNDSNSFYIQPYMLNFGVETQDCVDADGDLVFVYTTRRQLFSINTQLDEVGFAIGDQLLAHFDPVSSYVALHRSGTDAGLFISNGSGSVYRYQINKDSWSPVQAPVGGMNCIKSVRVAASDYRLLAGRSTGSGYILFRDLTSAQDEGQNFAGYATIGTIVVAPLAETVDIEGVVIERMPAGSDPVVSVLVNEVGGTFVPLPKPVNDPPLQKASTSLVAKRHYLKAAQTPLTQKTRHLQVKIAFAAENAQNELIGFALMKP